MSTEPAATTTTPPAQLPRSDSLAALVSAAVGLAAFFGMIPLGLTGEQAIALLTGIATLVAVARAIWERKAEVNRAKLLQAAREATEYYKTTAAQAQARHAKDVQQITAVAEVVRKAADPADATQLSVNALLELLRDYLPASASLPPSTEPLDARGGPQ